MSGGISKWPRRFCILQLSAAPVLAQPVAQNAPAVSGPDIVVTADEAIRAVIQGIKPERSVDEEGVSSYGADTVGDILNEIASEVGDTADEPLVFLNGQRVTDLGDVVDYPAEAIQRLDVLPRGAGARLGAPLDRRAYNVVLKRAFRSDIVTVADRLSTSGGWNSISGSFVVSRIEGQERLNLSLTVRDEGDLLESDRAIIQPRPAIAFDLIGNILADPRNGDTEIDPALSVLAGRVVTVAAVPAGVARPSVTDFVRGANQPNATDLGRFRTLRPGARSYSASLASSSQFAPWLTSSVNARLDSFASDSLLGLPTALLLLPPTNPFSVFDRTVAVVRFPRSAALEQRSRTLTGSVGLGMSATLGTWQISLNGRHQYNDRDTGTERQIAATLSPILLGEENPFAPDIEPFVPVDTDRASSVAHNATLQLSATGPVVQLPAGPVRANLNAGWNRLKLIARNRTNGFAISRTIDRTDRSAQGSLEIPVVSRRQGPVAALGDFSVNLDYGHSDVAGFGSIRRYGYSTTWVPADWMRVQGTVSVLRNLPAVEQLGDPVIVTTGVRYFDFLRNETVDVTQISGGNRALRADRLTTRRLSGSFAPWRAINLQINAEYVSTRNRNPISYLPPASADLIAAFPDRFVRDSNGRLVLVDTRAINFGRRSSDRTRYGASFVLPLSNNEVIGRSVASPDEPSEAASPPPKSGATPRPRLQFTLSHTINLRDDVFVRAGFPVVDLLNGGAIGFGGGQSRHLIDAGLNVSDRGVGVRLNGTWRSGTELNVGSVSAPGRLRFSPIAVFNLRAFADLRQLEMSESWLKGARLSINLLNVANTRQRVRDQNGDIPLRFQPAYRDPLGRTIEFELRKSF